MPYRRLPTLAVTVRARARVRARVLVRIRVRIKVKEGLGSGLGSESESRLGLGCLVEGSLPSTNPNLERRTRISSSDGTCLMLLLNLTRVIRRYDMCKDIPATSVASTLSCVPQSIITLVTQ